MASQAEKIAQLTLDVNDLKNKLDNIEERIENKDALQAKDREAIHKEIEAKDKLIEGLKGELAECKDKFSELSDDINELADSQLGIATNVNELIKRKNSFNQNIWKICMAIILAVITWYIRGAMQHYFESKKLNNTELIRKVEALEATLGGSNKPGE